MKIKTDIVQEIVKKLTEFAVANEKGDPAKKQEARLSIRYKNAENEACETDFVGDPVDIRKYLLLAIGDTAVSEVASKMRARINS